MVTKTDCTIEMLAPDIMRVRAVEIVRAMLKEAFASDVYFLSLPSVKMDYPRRPRYRIPARPNAFAVRRIEVNGLFTCFNLPRAAWKAMGRYLPEVSAVLEVTNDPDGEMDWKVWTAGITISGIDGRDDLNKFVLFDQCDLDTPQPAGYEIREQASEALRIIETELRYRGASWL